MHPVDCACDICLASSFAKSYGEPKPDPIVVKLDELLTKVDILTTALAKVARKFPLLGLKL
jgi:hypothetical protein